LKKQTLILNNFADIIDINFSCPSNKILNSESGGFLLKDVETIKRIIDRVIKVSNVPVSVKIRSGFKKGDNSFEKIGEICEEFGVSYLTIHPRSVTDKFYGDVDINLTKNLKSRTKIPIIHSGEVKIIRCKKVFKETNCDGIMIGRKAIGNPWIFQRLRIIYLLENYH